MPTQPPTSPEVRTPLSRHRVLRAAIHLVDQGGFKTLTMRRLGLELGVEAMSLYNHVANKDDPLDGMIDVVFGQIGAPPTGTDWKTAMRARAISARDALSRHPWATGLMESRARPGTANLRHHDAVLGSLRGAGFSVEMAPHAYSVLDGYIYGFALTKMNLPFDTSDVVEMGENILQRFPIDAYPHLAELIGPARLAARIRLRG